MAALLQNQHGAGALDHVLGKANAPGKGALLVQHGRRQFRGIDLAAGHGVEMSAAEGEKLIHQGLGIIDNANGRNGVNAQIGANENGLRVGIGDAADTGSAVHGLRYALEFRAKGRIFDIMNVFLEAVCFVDRHHARPAGAQVRMIIHAEEHVRHRVALQCRAKKSAHVRLPSFPAASGPLPRPPAAPFPRRPGGRCSAFPPGYRR